MTNFLTTLKNFICNHSSTPECPAHYTSTNDCSLVAELQDIKNKIDTRNCLKNYKASWERSSGSINIYINFTPDVGNIERLPKEKVEALINELFVNMGEGSKLRLREFEIKQQLGIN